MFDITIYKNFPLPDSNLNSHLSNLFFRREACKCSEFFQSEKEAHQASGLTSDEPVAHPQFVCLSFL